MIGIIGAMAIEVEELLAEMKNIEAKKVSDILFFKGTLCGSEVVVAEAGIGKVNAAVTAQTMILLYHPDYILNIGVAGGLADEVKVGDVVIADKVAEHDMDNSPAGDVFALGYITGINRVFMDCDKSMVEKLKACSEEEECKTIVGTIVSGDQFIHLPEQREKLINVFGGKAAEMEGAAIGHVCTMNHVPFGVLRSISDGANSESRIDFAVFSKIAAERSIRIIKRMLASV